MRLTRQTPDRFALDFVFALGDQTISVGWHESAHLMLANRTNRHWNPPATVYRYFRTDLADLLGPANSAGFVAVTQHRSVVSASNPVTTRIQGPRHKYTEKRSPDDLQHDLVRNIAERALAAGGLGLQTAVRDLVLPSLKRRIADQAAQAGAPAVEYRAENYPSTCALNVVVPFYGSLECVRNIMAVLTLVRDNDIGGPLAVTFVSDDPGLTGNLLGYVRLQNRYVNGLALAVLSHSTNLGFGSACNSGARATASEFTAFLNSDVMASGPETLIRLVKTLQNDPSIVAASPTLVYPDGILQARGLILEENPQFPGFLLLRPPCKGQVPMPGLPAIENVSLLPGAMPVVRTACFNEVGGFSTAFGSGDFEDAYLSHRLAALGRLVVIDATAIHLEARSYQRNVLDVLARSEIYREMSSQ